MAYLKQKRKPPRRLECGRALICGLSKVCASASSIYAAYLFWISLGGDFFRDKDGKFCYSAQTYVKRLNLTYETLFGEKPQTVFSPMDKDDHPELDNSPLCGPDDTSKYQSIIGALQWTIQLCRFDIAHGVMSMSRFRHAPRVGHITRIKRICGSLAKFPHTPFCTIKYIRCSSYETIQDT
jgi:hypothetical protein